eukprot:1057545-Rhodomonas_salina.1
MDFFWTWSCDCVWCYAVAVESVVLRERMVLPALPCTAPQARVRMPYEMSGTEIPYMLQLATEVCTR